jgi:hypothetical protein
MQDEGSGATPERKAASPKAEPISREELYGLVWAKPMLRVAEELGVSSSYMARVCTELRVPRPAQGFWTQFELGRAPEPPALPPVRQGDVTSWLPGATLGTTQRTAKKLEAAAAATANASSKQARRGRPLSKASETAIHPLLAGVKHHFLKSRDSDTGLLRPTKRMVVDIVTSEELLDGALGLANALFRALTAKGHRIALGPQLPQMARLQVNLREVPKKDPYQRTVWAPDRPTVLYLGALAIGLTLYEMTEDVESIYVKGAYVPIRDLNPEQRRRLTGPQHWTSTRERPSGRMCLQAYCPTSSRVSWVKRWPETKSGELLKVLPEIVHALEASVPELTQQLKVARAQQDEEQLQWQEQQRKWREEREQARKEEAHQAARAELLAAIAAWDEARRVEAYFADVLRAAELVEAGERDMLVDRVARARELVRGPSALDALLRWKSPSERK